MRGIRTLRANGRGLETEPRRTLHGHEAGNGGHGQGTTYRHRASPRPSRGAGGAAGRVAERASRPSPSVGARDPAYLQASLKCLYVSVDMKCVIGHFS